MYEPPVPTAAWIRNLPFTQPFPIHRASRRHRTQTWCPAQVKTALLTVFRIHLTALPRRRDEGSPVPAFGTTLSGLLAENQSVPPRTTDLSLGRGHQPRRTNGGGTPNRWMLSRIAGDNSRSSAASGILRITYREWVTTFVRILISRSLSAVSSQRFSAVVGRFGSSRGVNSPTRPPVKAAG